MKAYTHWLALYRRTICVLHLVRDVETKPCCPCLPSRALKELSFDPPVTPCNLHPNEFITNSSPSLCIPKQFVHPKMSGILSDFLREGPFFTTIRNAVVSFLDSPRPREAVDSRFKHSRHA